MRNRGGTLSAILAASFLWSGCVVAKIDYVGLPGGLPYMELATSSARLGIAWKRPLPEGLIYAESCPGFMGLGPSMWAIPPVMSRLAAEHPGLLGLRDYEFYVYDHWFEPSCLEVRGRPVYRVEEAQ